MELDLITQQTVSDCVAPLHALEQLPPEQRIDAINSIRLALHRLSPMQNEPVDCVLWVRADKLHANDYNPNSVAPPEMRLLQLSIQSDGYTQPIVAWPNSIDSYEVVDGFHRNRVGREVEAVRRRVMGRLPIAVIKPDRGGRENRMAATVRHNRARGKHGVSAMSDIVVDLTRRNWTAERIAKELGMDADEVLRLKQVSGIASLFSDREYSEAWEIAPNDAPNDALTGEPKASPR